eukprot:IDg4240t1
MAQLQLLGLLTLFQLPYTANSIAMVYIGESAVVQHEILAAVTAFFHEAEAASAVAQIPMSRTGG